MTITKPTTKVCRKCGNAKSLKMFSPDKGGTLGRHAYCKRCKSRQMGTIRKRDVEAAREYDRRIYRKDIAKRLLKTRSDEQFGKHILKKFGLTLEEYNAMAAAQGGLCAICGNEQSSGNARGWKEKKRLHVDHDHVTGAVRGLLCHHCNLGLGSFRDDPERLKQAINYLTTHESKANETSPSP